MRRLLHERRGELVREWEAAFREELGRPVTASLLREHLPALLDELAAGVEPDAAGEPEHVHVGGRAARRLESAQQLAQLLRELSLVRKVLLRLAGAGEDGAALARMNEDLDLELACAAEHFTALRERRLARLERADDALREREAFLRSVIDATPSMVFVKDVDGRFTLANEALARVYGTSVTGLLGKTDADFNPNAEEVAAFRRDDLEVIRTRREMFIAEEPVRTATGEARWYSTVKVPLVNEDGTCDHILGVATDITDRRRAEDALRVADRQKDQYLAMLAHELRNPLAAIASAAQVIRARLARGEGAERPLEILERQIRNSARLLDDLLDVSRITRGVLHLDRQEVRLDAIISSAVDAQRALIDAAGHELTVSLPDAPVVLEADPTRLEQIVSNLLNNAAKYTPARGRIEIVVERMDREVAIRVRDDGPGISPELLPRIFDSFAQAQQPLARPKGGLGLGLTLVRRLVEMHGGSVQALSAGPGKGSEFVVRLPARAAPAGAAARPGTPAVRQVRRRVLLVEDNADAAELLSEQLESLGHEVTIAPDGPAALEAAAGTDPDVVLLDIGLPGMDGYEVARRLRERTPGSRPVLVAITGYGQAEDRARSRAAGIHHHLTKPFEPSALERLLAELRGDGS